MKRERNIPLILLVAVVVLMLIVGALRWRSQLDHASDTGDIERPATYPSP